MSLTGSVTTAISGDPVFQDAPRYEPPPTANTTPVNGESRTVFSYHTSFAYAIGYKGTKDAPYYVRKLWVDGALIFDATTGFRDNRYEWTFYDGTQDAPDPFMRDDPQIGEDLKDVRYPELMYIVFRNINLSEFGLRPPDVTAELWAASGTPITEEFYVGGSPAVYPVIGINWDARRIYAPSDGGGLLLTFDLDTRQFLGYKPGIVSGSTQKFNYIPWLNWFFGCSLSNSARLTFQDAETMEVIGAIGNQSSSTSYSGSVTANDETVRIVSPNRYAYTFDYNDGTTYVLTRGVLTRKGLNLIHVRGRYDIIRPWFSNDLGIGEIAYICADHNRAAFYVITTAGDVYSFNPRTRSVRLLWVNPDAAFTGRGIHHDPHLDVLLVWHRAILPTRETVRGLRGGSGGVLWARVSQSYLPIQSTAYQQYNLSDTRAGTFGYGSSGNGIVLDIATGQQREYGNNFYGSRWDSVRFLFVGVSSGQLVDRLVTPFNPDDRVSLSTFLKDVGERMGYERANVVTVDIEDLIIGAILIDDTNARELLSDICNFYKINMVESGNTLRFTRRESGDDINVIADIDKRKMARLGAEDNSPTIVTNRLDENDIPSALTVWYIDRDADFTPIPYTANRTAATYDREARLNLPLVLDKNTVAKLATGMLYDAWSVQVTHSFLLPPRYGYLEPGDVIDIHDFDFTDTVRIRQATVNGDWSISVSASSVRENGDFELDVDETRQRALDEGLPTGNPRSIPVAIDAPLIDYTLETEGVSVVLGVALPARNTSEWPGAALLYESQSVERGLIANFRRNMVWGRVIGVLGDGAACATDYANTLRVQMPEPEFGAITEAASLGLETLMAVGRPGFWEFVTFGEYAYADGVATFSKLIRGRFGTEVVTGLHTSGEIAIRLTGGFATHFVKNADIGSIAGYTAIGVGEDLASGNVVRARVTGNSKRPYEPGDIRAALVGSDLSLTWQRRDRLATGLSGWRDSGAETTPLSEASEAYALEIYDTATGALVRAVADLSTPSYTYTEAQQIEDGYTLGGYVRMRVWQVSAEVGAGFSLERFVNVNS